MKEDTSPVMQEQCGFLLIKQMVTENSIHDGRNFKMYEIELEVEVNKVSVTVEK